MEWKEYQFNEICTLVNGRAYSNEELLSDGKYKVVRVGNLSGGNNTWFYSDLELPKDKYCHKGDLLFAWACTFGPHIWNEDNTIFHYHIWKLITKPEIVDKTFLYYYLKYKTGSFLGAVNGSVMVHITKGTMEKQIVRIPEALATQRRISSILSSLDRKIELNTKINATLEEMAQALFKSWFVDFEPFKNGNFIDTEIGKIPEGWRVGTLSEVAEINPKRTLKKGEEGTYLDMKNMPTSGSFPSQWERRSMNGGMKFKNGDTLMARITPCLENGKVAYVNFLEDEEVGFGSTEYIVITSKSGLLPEIFYTLCRYPDFVAYATRNMNGSSGRQRVSGEVIGNYKIAIPPVDVVKHLQPLFASIMKQVREHGFENRTLTHLRDTLLPRLMSGEIELEDTL